MINRVAATRAEVEDQAESLSSIPEPRESQQMRTRDTAISDGSAKPACDSFASTSLIRTTAGSLSARIGSAPAPSRSAPSGTPAATPGGDEPAGKRALIHDELQAVFDHVDDRAEAAQSSGPERLGQCFP